MKREIPPASWRDQYHNGWLPRGGVAPLNFWICDPAMRLLCDRIDARKVEIAKWVRLHYPASVLAGRDDAGL